MTKPVQVHNSAPELKAELRRRLVTELGGIAEARVLETHAGPGVMRLAAYKGVADWLGVDSDPASPDSIHADNRLVLRAIDLGRFNLFDVDAFGSPWEQLWIVSMRREIKRGEQLGIALTSGTQGGQAMMSPTLKSAGWSQQMLTAVNTDPNQPQRVFAGERGAVALAQRLILVWFSGCEVVRFWSARSPSGVAWYFGAVLRGR